MKNILKEIYTIRKENKKIKTKELVKKLESINMVELAVKVEKKAMEKIIGKESNMIIGNFNKWKIVEDGRTLRAMEKRGLISQSEYSVFPQVDADLSQFVYKDRTYWIKYFEGSFFPFVVTLTDEYIHANWNNLKEKYRKGK